LHGVRADRERGSINVSVIDDEVERFLVAAEAHAVQVLASASRALEGAQAHAATDFRAEADRLQADADSRVHQAELALEDADETLTLWKLRTPGAVAVAEVEVAKAQAQADALLNPDRTVADAGPAVAKGGVS
jgi:hypothetical protein